MKTETEARNFLITVIGDLIPVMKDEAELFIKALNFVETKHGKNEKAEKIVTAYPFLVFSLVDIFILFKLYLSNTDSIEKNLLCRTSAHHMYEFLEDASGIFGSILQTVDSTMNKESVSQNILELRKFFNDLKKKLHSEFKIIRHNVSGHKDKDVRHQYQIMKSLRFDDFNYYFEPFIKLHTKIRNLIHEIITFLPPPPDEYNKLNPNDYDY